MGEDNQTKKEREYIAFISYRHLPLDQLAAEKIQQKIERYRVPKDYREAAGGSRLGMVFRDEDELPASSSLTDSITYALDHSKYLIVICTPDLPLSKWCETEIQYFLQNHDRNHILAVLADGTPETSFSPYMRFEYGEKGDVLTEIEPLAANIAGDHHSIDSAKLRKEIVRIYAALLGCPFDALWQRERRYKSRRILTASGALMIAMAAVLAIVISKNAQISDQNKELILQKSTLLTDAGNLLLEQHDIKGARLNILSALETENNLPYDLRAEKLLCDINGCYTYQNVRPEKIIKQTFQIDNAVYGKESGMIFTVDQYGIARCINPDEGNESWSCSIFSEGKEWMSLSSGEAELMLSPDEEVLYTFCKNNIKAVKAMDGTQIWNHSMGISTSGWCLSEDGSLIAVLDGKYIGSEKESFLKILDASDGSEIISMPLDEMDEEHWMAYVYNFSHLLSGLKFSSDNRYLGLVFRQQTEDETKARCRAWIIDLEQNALRMDKIWEIDGVLSLEIQGIHISDDGRDLFISLYDADKFGIETRMLHVDAEDEPPIFHEWLPSYIPLLGEMGRSDRLPVLTSEHLAVTVIEDQMYVRSLTDGSSHGRWQVDGNVIGLSWLDREEEVLWAATDKGNIYHIVLQHDNDEYPLGKISQYKYNLEDHISAAWMVDEKQMIFTQESNPSVLMMFKNVNDPNYISLIESDELTSRNPEILLSPSGNNIFVVDDHYDEPVILYSFDRESLKLTAKAMFEDIPWISDKAAITAFSDDAVLYGFWILHTDGTVSYPEDMSQEYYDAVWSLVDNAKSTLTTDGHNVAVTFIRFVADEAELQPDSPYNSYMLGRCWIDGVKNETRLRVSRLGKYLIGKNGLIITYGQLIRDEDGLISDEGDGEAYLVWNVNDDSFIRIEDECQDNQNRKVIAGKHTPIFVSIDSDGFIRLYDSWNGQCKVLADSYEPGSVLSGVFFDNDRYFAAVSYTGIDIYRTEDAENVYSSSDITFSKDMEGMNLEATEMSDGRFMLISKKSDINYGDAIILDTQPFSMTSSINDVAAYIPAADRIIARRYFNIVAYPYYNKEKLVEMAKGYH